MSAPATAPRRVAFLGSAQFGLPTLEALRRHGHTIVCVVTQPDRPSGRGRATSPTPVGAWAAAHLPGVPLLKPEDINAQPHADALRALAGPGLADAWVVIAFGQKLAEPLLRGVRAINLHASLLPRWRGAAPIHAAILAGDAHTGNTVITLAQRMDAGLILASEALPIPPTATTEDLYATLSQRGPTLVLGVVGRLDEALAAGRDQDESHATRARKLSRADAWFDPAGDADTARRRINALSPWPGVSATLAGAELKLLRADALPAHPATSPADPARRPGALVDPARGLFACGSGLLRILEAQPVGSKPMSWGALINGRAIPEGATLVPTAGPPPVASLAAPPGSPSAGPAAIPGQ